jgi:REP element-mobilizing transposase RayT
MEGVAPQSGSGVPPLSEQAQRRDASVTIIPELPVTLPTLVQSGSGVPPLISSLRTYFDPSSTIAFISGDLPHWRQVGTTYFVTFRLADSLPQEKLIQWRCERDQWHATHPEPHDETTRLDYYARFPQRLQQWLDAGTGSCVLARPEVKNMMENALCHFDNQRYKLNEFIVAANHIHVILTPLGEHTLSKILHSWKSFTAHEIIKIIKSGSGVPPLNSNEQSRDGSATLGSQGVHIWQKESFDHIVRSPSSLEKFQAYIRGHCISHS